MTDSEVVRQSLRCRERPPWRSGLTRKATEGVPYSPFRVPPERHGGRSLPRVPRHTGTPRRAFPTVPTGGGLANRASSATFLQSSLTVFRPLSGHRRRNG